MGTSHLLSTVTEHISRKGRVELVRLVLENGWQVQELAVRLGVSRRAIYFWLNPHETHPDNSHLEDLVGLAIEVNGRAASEILLREVNQFRVAVNEEIWEQFGRRVNKINSSG